MDVRNCKGCGRLFNYLSGPPLCQACRDALEIKFQDVKQYLRENPNTSMQTISEQFDVPIPQIRQWIREERLTFSPDSSFGIDCEGCGKTIKTGRYCETCRTKMTVEFGGLVQKAPSVDEGGKKVRSKDRMRFLDK